MQIIPVNQDFEGQQSARGVKTCIGCALTVNSLWIDLRVKNIDKTLHNGLKNGVALNLMG